MFTQDVTPQMMESYLRQHEQDGYLHVAHFSASGPSHVTGVLDPVDVAEARRYVDHMRALDLHNDVMRRVRDSRDFFYRGASAPHFHIGEALADSSVPVRFIPDDFAAVRRWQALDAKTDPMRHITGTPMPREDVDAYRASLGFGPHDAHQ